MKFDFHEFHPKISSSKGYVSSGMEMEYTEIFSQTKVNDKAKSSAKESKSESIAKKFLKHEKITWKGTPKTHFWWLFRLKNWILKTFMQLIQPNLIAGKDRTHCPRSSQKVWARTPMKHSLSFETSYQRCAIGTSSSFSWTAKQSFRPFAHVTLEMIFSNAPTYL